MAANPAVEYPRQYEGMLPVLPVNGKLGPEQSSDVAYEAELETMPSRRISEDDEFDLRTLIHNNAATVALQAKTIDGLIASVQVLVKVQERPAIQPVVQKQAPWWFSPAATFLGLAIGVMGIKYIPASTAVADKQMTMMEYRQNEADKREALREREMRLMQQYNTNLHLWFADHGIKGVPSPPKLDLDK